MGNDLLSPTGIMMLLIAGTIDIAGIICAILIWAFGVGALLGQIVNVAGYIMIGGFLFLRSGDLSAMKKMALLIALGVGVLLAIHLPVGGFMMLAGIKSAAAGTKSNGGGMATGLLKKFLKRQWKKLIPEALPAIGDIYPGFTHMIYSELNK